MTSREIDVLIVEKVFKSQVAFLNQKAGWRIDYRAMDNQFNDPIDCMGMIDGWRLRRYSQDLNASCAVINRLQQDEWGLNLKMTQSGGTTAQFYCTVGARGRYDSTCEEPALAICQAALLAVERWGIKG